MIAGRFFVTPHAVERFRARIAPRLSYDQALGVIVRSLESADRWKKAKSRPDRYWLRTRRPYALRVLVGPGEGPLPAVVTILPGGRGGRRPRDRGPASGAKEEGMASTYDHVWWWRSRLPERKGQRCRVLVRGRRMNTVLVEFEDGYLVTTSRYAVRRARRESDGE